MQRVKDEHSYGLCDTSSHASNAATNNTSLTSNNDNLRSDTEPERQSRPESQSRSENEVNNVRQENNSPVTNYSIINRINKLEECMSSILTIQTEAIENRITEMKKIKQQFKKTQKLICTENMKEARVIAHEENTDEHNNVEINRQKLRLAQNCLKTFEGKKEENVQDWFDQILDVACLFKLSEHECTQVAIKQLRGSALSWFNQQPFESMNQWKNFKSQFQRHFSDERVACMTIINERVWEMYDEKFTDYATDKLALIKTMGFNAPRHIIDLLIDGVREPKLRMALLDKKFTSYYDCINYVEKIINDDIVSAYIFNK